jgi:outer membrane lipoprotein-sorting protein
MRTPSISDRSVHRLALLAVVALAAVSAGCAVMGGGDGLPDGATVEEKLDSLDAIEATVVNELNDSNDVNSSRSHTIARLDTGESRSRVVSGANETLTVSNGSRTWLYDRSANRVRILDLNTSSVRQNSSFESYVTVFERLRASSDDESTPAEISQLPVVPAAGGGSSSPVGGSLSFYGNVSLTYNGTETVAGRETHAVTIEPLRNDSAIGTVELWFDTEWYYPIRTNTSVSVGGDRTVVTTTYRNVTFNPDVPPGTFEFDPPANATVVESTYESRSFESRESLVAATDIEVPDPNVPAQYRFESGSLTTYRGNETLSLQYTNGSATVLVSKEPDATPLSPTNESGERVDVAGREGRISEVLDERLLTWRCEGATYRVIGPASRETLVDIAVSMTCE